MRSGQFLAVLKASNLRNPPAWKQTGKPPVGSQGARGRLGQYLAVLSDAMLRTGNLRNPPALD
jgi:hypothetical protein